MTDPTPHRRPIDRLMQRLTVLIGVATDALERDMTRLDAWQQEVARQLARYTQAAYLAGSGEQQPSARALAALEQDIKAQLGYLSQFATEIQDADEWKAGWNARAAMYAKSIKLPYWRGVTKMLPLPSMPTEGVQCLTNCGCSWEVVTVNEENNDYDAYWRRSKDDSCQSCVQREREWSPVQIRDGVLL